MEESSVDVTIVYVRVQSSSSQLYCHRGVINGKAGKAAALPKFSDSLTLSQPGGSDYAHTLALPHLTIFYDYVPGARSPEAPTSLMSARYCLIKIPQLCTLSLYIRDRKNMQIIQ